MSRWFGGVGDIADALRGSIDSVFTVLGIILTIAVLSLALPYVISLVQTGTSLATGAASSFGGSVTTTTGGTTSTIH
jgi:hypothetical protein